MVVAPLGNPTALFELDPAAPASNALTTFAGIGLIGGQVGLRLDSSGAGKRNVLVDKMVFDKNQMALSATAINDAEIESQITDCRIQDLVTGSTFPVAISLQSQTVGIHIQTEEDGGMEVNSKANITISNLSLTGDFDDMARSATTIGALNLKPYHEVQNSTTSTRLIEVFNYVGDREHTGANTGTSEAVVTISGCNLDGKANTSLTTGWDWGVYAFGLGDIGITGSIYDYTSLFDITVTGSTFDNFEEGGIFGYTSISARGTYSVNGGTVIKNTGSHLVSASKPYLHSGIYLENYESYLGIEGFKMQSTGNLGNGVFAFSDAAIAADIAYETGLFIGLEACELNANQQAGIEMRVHNYLPSESPTLGEQVAIVGGTWSQDPTTMIRSLIEDGNEVMSGVIPLGQGYINRCLIHDNNGPGVYAKIQGYSTERTHSICNRMVNSFLWNNTGGGFLAELDPKSNDPADPISDQETMPSFFFGILNCTFVENGSGASDYSLEVIDTDGTGTTLQGNYSHVEGANRVATRLLTSIFDRSGLGNGQDFGSNLSLLMVHDENFLPFDFGDLPPLDSRIGVAALRGVRGLTDLGTQFRYSTSLAPPYLGGVSFPDKWYLDNSLLNFSFFDHSLHSLSIVGTEYSSDYRLNGRPGITMGDIDKGAEQAQ